MVPDLCEEGEECGLGKVEDGLEAIIPERSNHEGLASSEDDGGGEEGGRVVLEAMLCTEGMDG